ncbi:hypothetical protein N7449_008972 [Penicillium cf. viridicatum]|uniref:NmrA-like domain-containing protein n=1 Tax=Penicillium cf. viridicatum TaxID=2972119 RepID=A0A9W9J9G4_9EURO|nr:hypothetical protein N7449_008972 [Penicillium cf. viridicatum]
MTLKYLITGATGGLGGLILEYFIPNIPLGEFAVSSSRTENKGVFERRGIQFRHLNYEDPATLEVGLRDVQNLLFVSTNTNVIHIDRILRHHRNVVTAAAKANVLHVWYTSLPFGGFGNDSEVAVQQQHIATEKMLQESGLVYTCIREGIYTEAFPLFLNWYADTTHIILPYDGEVAFTSREDLAEGTARLMIRGGYEKETVLLTAGETITAMEIVDTINQVTGRQLPMQLVSKEEFLAHHTQHDKGKKSMELFEILASWWKAAARGELKLTDGLLGEILGREPLTPQQAVKKLLQNRADHTWHQNYA